MEIIHPVSQYVMDDPSEADAYLTDLLRKEENRSMDVVRLHAERLIKDDALKTYFIGRAADMMATR